MTADVTQNWCVYLIECRNGAYYCGISTDASRRWRQHVAGKAAKYTRAYPPVQMRLLQDALSRGEALQREYRIKQLSRVAKKALWQEAPVLFHNVEERMACIQLNK